jgi:hypothetical protein
MIRCVNTEYSEYPYSLYLLVLTVSDISDTGTQIHLLDGLSYPSFVAMTSYQVWTTLI